MTLVPAGTASNNGRRRHAKYVALNATLVCVCVVVCYGCKTLTLVMGKGKKTAPLVAEKREKTAPLVIDKRKKNCATGGRKKEKKLRH